MIRASVPADGVILVYGWDWSSAIPYYAQRRAVMVPEGREEEFAVLDVILERLPPRRIAGMLIRDDPRRLDKLGFARARTSRFHFSPAPFATSEAGALYLPEEAVPAAATAVRGRVFAGVTLASQPSGQATRLPETDLTALAFPMASPRPTAARSEFGINIGEAGVGHPVILAHPHSELDFTPPPGATRILAEFGIAAAAYAPDAQAVTDGIVIEIVEHRANGLRRVIYRRHLDPVKIPADRGPQQISLNEAGPFDGQVSFRITPGPQQNLVNDWAYWGRIEIR